MNEAEKFFDFFLRRANDRLSIDSDWSYLHNVYMTARRYLKHPVEYRVWRIINPDLHYPELYEPDNIQELYEGTNINKAIEACHYVKEQTK